MKFSADKKSLAEALAFASSVIKSTTLPVLSLVRVAAADGKVSVTGNNLDQMATGTTLAQVSERGDLCCSPKILAAAIDSCGSTVEVAATKDTIKVGGFSIRLIDPAEFDSAMLKASAGDFRPFDPDALRYVARFQSSEQTRYVLNGVHIGRECAVATDGRFMAVYALETDMDLIVPTDAVAAAIKADARRIAANENWVAFRDELGTRELLSKVVEGMFPNWQQVVPDRTDHLATLCASDLAEKLRVLGALALGKDDGMALEFADGKAIVTARTPDGDAYRDEIEADVANPIKIGLSASRLRACIDTDADKIDIRGTDDTGPVVFYDAGKPENFRILMPMRINH